MKFNKLRIKEVAEGNLGVALQEPECLSAIRCSELSGESATEQGSRMLPQGSKTCCSLSRCPLSQIINFWL